MSHSSANNAEAIALRDWLIVEGWNDLFLDLDPDRGIAAGERWERALNEAARRCEAVLFLISTAWLSSRWCLNELNLARRLNKRLFGVLIEEGINLGNLPSDVASTWQLVNLATGRDHRQFRIRLPITSEEVHVTFSIEGLGRLKLGLQRAGLHASYFNWPPEYDPNRAPYRGLKPLEADDAGIFFGREAQVIEAIDRLRGLIEAAPPRLMVILGASGAGKSSFLRGGLLPRIGRDPQTFLPLPVIRPERSAISGETGLVSALTSAFEAATLKVARGDVREAVAGGAAMLKSLLARLQAAAQLPAIEDGPTPKAPTLVLAIDQGEELFLADAQSEAQPFLALLRGLLKDDGPPIIAVFTIRSDNYERLQAAPELDGVHQETLSLPPMPKGSYAEVVKGPLLRLDGTARAVRMDDALVDALLRDIEEGGAKDALPLLAFTLERLYAEYGATGHLTLDHYDKLGRVQGSIEGAVERAFKAADSDTRVPRDRQARLTLLRRGLIPWLAGIDPDTKAPRRRIARLSEVPAEARPLIDLLVEQRLLSTDVTKETGEKTIEPAHEALLRQWGLLQSWLSEDTGLLTVLDGIKRASRDWAANGQSGAWLTHRTERLRTAEQLLQRHDLAANLEPTDRAYIAACRSAEHAQRGRAHRVKAIVSLLVVGIIAVAGLSYAGFLNQSYLKIQARFLADRVISRALTVEAERLLNPGDLFQECWGCPKMVVIPPGTFMMGSDELGEEQPVHRVTIARPFAVSQFPVTYDEWDSCVAHGGCKHRPGDHAWGRGQQPVVHVSWVDTGEYLTWLSKQTGKAYRLLTEAEWEYAARASIANDNAPKQPVRPLEPNAFGLYEMHGSVWQWVKDSWHKDYSGAPEDGSDRQGGDDSRRVMRGGGWYGVEEHRKPALRSSMETVVRVNFLGIRVARTL